MEYAAAVCSLSESSKYIYERACIHYLHILLGLLVAALRLQTLRLSFAAA